MYKVVGDSYLDAARAARQKWEDDGLGVYLELQPAEGKSSASLEISTPGGEAPFEVDREEKAREALRDANREFFVISWQQLTRAGADKPLHFLQITNRHGDLIETAVGDDHEDSLLEIAERLLPSWHRPPESR